MGCLDPGCENRLQDAANNGRSGMRSIAVVSYYFALALYT